MKTFSPGRSSVSKKFDRFHDIWESHSKVISRVALGLGFGTLTASAIVGLRVELGWRIWLFLVPMGFFELVWLLASDASPVKKKPHPEEISWRRHLTGFGAVLVGLLSITLFASESTPAETDPCTENIGRAVVMLLFVTAVGFLIVIVGGVVRSSSEFVGSYRPNTTHGRLRLELWYGYAGSATLGLALGVLIRSHAGIWSYVILTGVAVVIITCVLIVAFWRTLGKAKSDAGKLLVRQGSLTCLLCLALLIQAIDRSAMTAPTAIASAAGVMLVPTLIEFLTAVLRERRSNATVTDGAEGTGIDTL